MNKNFILASDSYKYSHAPSQEETQFPKGTTYLEYYLESRGGHYGKTEFAGLQIFINEVLTKPITRENVEQAKKFMELHGEPFNYEGWMGIVEKHNGFLPLKISAVPEGAVVPTGNILVKVQSTDPEFFWVAGWIETALLRAVWYPTTIATRSFHMKKTVLDFLIKTSDDPKGEIDFKVHDFGARGVSSAESAGLGGCAHLFNFMGSDTVEGIVCANEHYDCEMAAFSIPAAEHSTITSYGRENEVEAYRNKIKLFAKPGKLFAVVSDSWHVYDCVDNIWCDTLLNEVKNSGATCVIRPDSGDPCEVNLKILQIMERKIGMRTNMKGYKVLPNYFRLIQGDGIKDEEAIYKILHHLTSHGYSATNIAFGSGGGLLQMVNRDTQKFAYKCNRAIVNGMDVAVFKDPITDNGKRSKSGPLDLIKENGQYKTVNYEVGNASELKVVYENGKVLKRYTLSEIRNRVNKELGI
jgi:nicotinamide phosphoribosyltransferase